LYVEVVGSDVSTRGPRQCQQRRERPGTRERYPWKFEKQQATTTRRALTTGDYAAELAGEVVGVVERKKLQELAGNVVDGSLLVALAELATARRAAGDPALGPGVDLPLSRCCPSLRRGGSRRALTATSCHDRAKQSSGQRTCLP
jgi:hypothetical protein